MSDEHPLFVIIYLLHCNFLPSFHNFSVLAHENKKYLLEIKRKPANHVRQIITK